MLLVNNTEGLLWLLEENRTPLESASVLENVGGVELLRHTQRDPVGIVAAVSANRVDKNNTIGWFPAVTVF